MKRTIVLGASSKPERYSYKAVVELNEKGYEVFPLGIKTGDIQGLDIITDLPQISYVHTITIYLRAERQSSLYEYILNTKPKRLIFNPGSENPELVQLAQKNKIKVENACTLVMLTTGQY